MKQAHFWVWIKTFFPVHFVINVSIFPKEHFFLNIRCFEKCSFGENFMVGDGIMFESIDFDDLEPWRG